MLATSQNNLDPLRKSRSLKSWWIAGLRPLLASVEILTIMTFVACFITRSVARVFAILCWRETSKKIAKACVAICTWSPREIRSYLRAYQDLCALDAFKAADFKIQNLCEYYWLRQTLAQESPEFFHPLQRPAIWIPGLRPRTFFDWRHIEGLEAIWSQRETLRQEYLCSQQRLRPYRNESGLSEDPMSPTHSSDGVVAYHDDRWKVAFLYRAGRRIDEDQSFFPTTYRLLTQIPTLDQTFVMLSVLESNTWIPPHYGLCNGLIRVHIPIIVPESCSIEVGGEQRDWNEPLVFDDSFRHQVSNRGPSQRVVLFFNIFHPELSVADRERLRRFVQGTLYQVPAVKYWDAVQGI